MTGNARASSALVKAHNLLRDELSAIRGLIAAVEHGRAGAGQARSALSEMTLRQNAWHTGAYCQDYCRLVTMHHSGEDAEVFPHLRASEPALGPVLDRLGAEHEAIHQVLDAVDRALVDFVANPGDATGLRDVVDQLTGALLGHLAYEERELIEPLNRHGLY